MMRILFVIAALAVMAAAYEAPDDCDWTFVDDVEGYAGGVALTCHLNAINSNLEKTNFSVIPSELTRKLTVICNQDFYRVSRLEPASFASLSELTELVLQDCHIDHVPALAFEGLNKLESLSIRTGLPDDRRLAVGIDGFVGISGLKRLEMTGNNLRSIPPNELCNLPELTHLELADNDISSIDDLGVSSSDCLRNLVRLDLHENSISKIGSSLLNLFPKMQDLDLSFNSIETVSQEYTVQEPECSLIALDLSENFIVSMPATFFRECATLTSLKLTNNSLSEVHQFLLKGLSSLETLELSGNQLKTFSGRLTRDLTALKHLSLNRNLLRKLEGSEVFAPMSETLESLNLSDNQIDTIADNVFGTLVNLKQLDLTNNNIDVVTKNTFSGLRGASHLLLGNNRLQSVHSESLNHLSDTLLVLDLSANSLAESPSALSSLRKLQTLDLSNNQISSIVDASFLKMNSLWRLQLNGNALKNVTVGLFKNMKSLQILDLSYNTIQYIEKGSLDSNQKLQAVRLDNNRLTRMDGLFQNLQNLIWLNVSDNSIGEFDYAFLPLNLKWLDMSHNRIVELGNYFDFTGDLSLTELDVSFNSLTQLGPHNLPDSIETLLVNDNKIVQIVPYTFFKKTNLVKVDLTVNSLKTIDKNALRLSSEIQQLPDFYLTGNPIECDCEMVWLKSINSAGLQNYPIVKDIESIYCRLVYTRQQTFVPLVETRNDQFLCPYKTHCFALCQCCDFDACDCEMTCPDNCTCYHDSSWSKNIAECSSSGFHDLPDQLPMDATEVFLDGNIFPELFSHTFIGRKNLRILHLNNSQIHTIHNKTFNGLKSLTALHLQDNDLKALKGYEFEALPHLRELYLDGNIISYVHNATFKFLKSLEILHIHNNRLIDFPVWQLALNPFLVSVKLAENLWSCDCEFADRFKSWLSVYSSKVVDADAISCVSNEQANELMQNINELLCDANGSSSAMSAPGEKRHVDDHLPLLAATLASFAVVLLIILAAFIYRNTLRVWIHSKYGVRVFDNKDLESADPVENDGKLFDAFITYSPKDDVFAREILANELEQSDEPFRTCLYHRDLPGNQYVADTILQATEASRRTILVLSENFLKSEWSRYDYKSGLHQALRAGRKKLIVIMLGDIASRELDPDLRLYLKNSLVLNWGEKLFWERLKYALPDVRKRKSHSPNSTVVSSMSDSEQLYQPRYATISESGYAGHKLNNNANQGMVYVPNLPGQQVPVYGQTSWNGSGGTVAAVHI